MKNFIKAFVLIAVIAIISFLMPGLMDSTEYKTEAGEAEFSEEGSESEGVDSFTVLEIVPYHGMGEVGYLVDGEEPIEENLLTYDNAVNGLEFLDGAVDVYHSYMEGALPASGTADTGWSLANYYINQNGYFVEDRRNGTFSYVNGNNYVRVADGAGNYRAVLSSMDTVYNATGTPTNQKNVNTYFVYGRPTGVSLYSTSWTFEPYSVTENATHTGDYDYNLDTGAFYLNKGLGRYDVLFVRSYNNTNNYYMLNDYEIVHDNTGEYSFAVTYSAQTGGNYALVSTFYFNYNMQNGRYRWVQDDTALTKTNYSTDSSGRTWVRNQKIIKQYEYKYNITFVNNEWFKLATLGLTAAQCEDFPVNVITMTPEELSIPANQHYITDADLYYINANYEHDAGYFSNYDYNYLMLYENYSSEGLNLPASEKYYNTYRSKSTYLNFAVHDMSWDSVLMMFKKIAGIGCSKTAAIVDTIFYSEAMDGTGAYNSVWRSVTVPYDVDTGDDNGATMCNMAKLYLMIYQRNTIDFYNSFLNPVTTTYLITQQSSVVNKSGTTGSFIRPDSTNPSPTANAAMYWNENTFLPYGLNVAGVMTHYTDTEVEDYIENYDVIYDNSSWWNNSTNMIDLMDNVLSVGDNGIFTGDKFVSENWWNSAYYSNLMTDETYDILIENESAQNGDGTVDTSVSLSDLVNVITNDGNGYDDTGAVAYPEGSTVEGDPTTSVPPDTGSGAVDTGASGSGLRDYKCVLNIQPTSDFTVSEEAIESLLSSYDVKIVSMTSTEFNGCIDDINTKYDLIYMGSKAGRFNYLGSNTVFNNTTLANAIYFTTGDYIYINDGLRPQDYYRGNDISTQKKADLVGFLDAGYPIVVESGIYSQTNVRNTTNIYSFITGAKSYNNFLSLANLTSTNSNTKISSMAKLKTALNITRPIINLIEPQLADDATVSYVYVDPVTDLLKIQFALLPKGKVPSEYTYDAYLYLDDNGDGIFDDTERVNVISAEGSTGQDLRESKYKSYTYNYDMSGMNGVCRWKLMLERTDNPKIHSNVTGYVAHTEKKNIYILQIIESSLAYNLENKVNDTASLIYQYAGTDKLTDYNIIFDSLTVQEFELMYATKPYTTATSAETDKLSKYHMLILDNPTTAISNTYGALTNIKDEIADNLSVLYTKGALRFSNQSGYYATAKNSFLDYRTYNYINRYALATYNSKAQYYIYSSLSDNGTLSLDTTYKTTYLTKANEGTITRYPYQINAALKIAENNYSNEVTIDYNLSQSQKLIGWYCLSDSKSPVVRKAGLYTAGTKAEWYKGIYSSSPNDVKNNYYLFSYRLCYYSGIKLSSADVTGNDDEIKLFVNTIITAYKATTRTVSSPPVIAITDPVPVVAADLSKSIIVTADEIDGTDFVLTFKITESSSNMDLSVLLDGTDPVDSWNDRIYEVAGGVLGTEISINNTNKYVANKTYALVIPISAIDDTHLLSIKATNSEGNVTSEKVTLKYTQTPQVSIIDPVLMTNASKSYLYADIDFNALDTDEDYLNSAKALRVVFKVENSLTNMVITINSGSDNLTDGSGYDVIVYPRSDDLGTPLTTFTDVANGEYVMYIPVALMKDVSSREIMVTATDLAANSDQASVTLLRRSLFPLD